ncbi:restriction endonuclease subunit S [Pacificispira sp.]|uniref:restriction endonuclease subunit S n=1 Tax=Pacificispira sp. TaxID=2888761 RepID=UPI003B52B369
MSSNWQQMSFTDVVRDETGGNIKTLQSDFLPSGRYPIVDQGKELIAGYTNDESRLCKADLPVIVFGDHTKCFKFIDFPFCLGADGTKVLRPKIDVDERFLFYAMQRIHIPEAGYSRHFKYLKQGSVPLPPLEDQKRIAAILDQADDLRRLRQTAISKLNTLIQSMFYEMFGEALQGDFFEFGQAVEEFRYGTSNKSGDEGLPTLRIPNVIGGGIDTTEIKTVEVTGPELARLRLRDGDLLFVRTNGNPDYVGRCATFSLSDVADYDAEGDWIFASYLIRARLSDRINPIFAKTYFSSRGGRAAIRERCKTSAGQFNINTESLASLPFPNVPRTDQDRFAEAAITIERNGVPMKRSATKMDEQFASLQYSAFRGEL